MQLWATVVYTLLDKKWHNQHKIKEMPTNYRQISIVFLSLQSIDIAKPALSNTWDPLDSWGWMKKNIELKHSR